MSGKWSTIVCMSSETHFHSTDNNQNGGLAVRVHSMENLKWTKNREHAAELIYFANRNYGVLGKKFTEYLFKEDVISTLESRYIEAKEKMIDICKADEGKFTDRLCETYALTYMTAEILKKIGLDIELNAVAEIMKNHNTMVPDEQNIAKNAYNAIISYIVKYGGSPAIRLFSKYDHITKVAVEENEMGKILKYAGFKDLKVAVKELDSAGYIIRQVKKGIKSKLKIGSLMCWCYQVNMKYTRLKNNEEPCNLPNHDVSGKEILKSLYISDEDVDVDISEDDDEEYIDDDSEDIPYVESSGIDWSEIHLSFNAPKFSDDYEDCEDCEE